MYLTMGIGIGMGQYCCHQGRLGWVQIFFSPADPTPRDWMQWLSGVSAVLNVWNRNSTSAIRSFDRLVAFVCRAQHAPTHRTRPSSLDIVQQFRQRRIANEVSERVRYSAARSPSWPLWSGLPCTDHHSHDNHDRSGADDVFFVALRLNLKGVTIYHHSMCAG